MTNLEPETLFRNFLRSQLTDYNLANRSGSNWIYDDWPNDALTKHSFPRIVVRKFGEVGRMIGIGDNDTWDELLLQVDVLVHKDLGVISITQTDESIAVIANSPRISFDYLPQTVTNIKHTVTAFGTVTAKVNDSDFTSPSAGTVEWSKSTGNLNFATADLTSYSGETITSTYVEQLEGEMLAKKVGRDVVNAVRENWRQDAFLDGMTIPELVSGPQVMEFGKPEGWHRLMLEYRFRRYNTGTEI